MSVSFVLSVKDGPVPVSSSFGGGQKYGPLFGTWYIMGL